MVVCRDEKAEGLEMFGPEGIEIYDRCSIPFIPTLSPDYSSASGVRGEDPVALSYHPTDSRSICGCIPNMYQGLKLYTCHFMDVRHSKKEIIGLQLYNTLSSLDSATSC